MSTKLGGFIAQTSLVASNADDAYAETLEHLLNHGGLVRANQASLSVGADKASKEILNFSLILTDPYQRLTFNPQRKINAPAAVARFVWMMAGSDRLADIAFYEPKVKYFSDDGISVPGSNYGQRILRPRPGLNQLESAVLRLKEDAASRRAAISIYHPEDAVRSSKDIPCAFGLFYHVRDGALIATTMMRSNNALVLLPYNLFEFSLLAEAVAVELDLPLAALVHDAASMHLYDADFQAARTIVAARSQIPNPLPSIPRIPRQSSPFAQIRELVILEAELRHASAGLDGHNLESWITKGQEKLNAYWRQYFYLLILHVAKLHQDARALELLQTVISKPWMDYVGPDAFKASPVSPTNLNQLLELDFSDDPYRQKIVPLHSTRVHQSLREQAADWEKRSDVKLRWDQFADLEVYFSRQLAARGGEDFQVSQEEFVTALSQLQ